MDNSLAGITITLFFIQRVYFFPFLIIAAVSWTWVLAGRIGDRFGKGIRTAPRDAIIADSTDPRQKGKSFGLHRMLDTAGAVIGVAQVMP